MACASTMLSLDSISGYSSATRLNVRRNSPSQIFMMFALCTHAMRLRPCLRAYSNAARQIRSDPISEITLIPWATVSDAIYSI